MKGALLAEFYSWRHKRIWLTLAVVAGAVACSASEILFVFLFGIMPIMSFASGMLAFKGDYSQAVEEFKLSVPVSREQRIAARYIVLLCENVVMWLCYAFACFTVDTPESDIPGPSDIFWHNNAPYSDFAPDNYRIPQQMRRGYPLHNPE